MRHFLRVVVGSCSWADRGRVGVVVGVIRGPQERGGLGALKGGKSRAANMTPEERSESACKAAKARWDKKKQEKE